MEIDYYIESLLQFWESLSVDYLSGAALIIFSLFWITISKMPSGGEEASLPIKKDTPMAMEPIPVRDINSHPKDYV